MLIEDPNFTSKIPNDLSDLVDGSANLTLTQKCEWIVVQLTELSSNGNSFCAKQIEHVPPLSKISAHGTLSLMHCVCVHMRACVCLIECTFNTITHKIDYMPL